MRIRPAARIRGRLRVPGDKSISHRAAIIAALAEGTSHLSNFSTSQDCASTLSCLANLGVAIEREESNVRVSGCGAHGLRPPTGPLDCGNSGSTMRMLAGVLGGQSFNSILTGDQSLLSRPMKRIIEPLALMGVRIASDSARPPLHVAGAGLLKAIRYELPVASAQVKSCVLLAGLNAGGRTEVIETFGPTRDHTERMLQWFGGPVATHNDQSAPNRVAIEGPVNFSARDLRIPGDISSAAFFLAAAALLPESHLEIVDVGLNPTRAQIVSTMISLGADIEIARAREDCNEMLGDLIVRGAKGQMSPRPLISSNIIAGPLVAQLIDELPMLAVLGTQLQGGIEIRDAAELRVKESDRIAATVHNLRAMGAEVTEHEDGLVVAGPTRLRGALIDARGDHRIAMAFAVAALVADGESEISGSECVGVSFPEFFDLLESVVER